NGGAAAARARLAAWTRGLPGGAVLGVNLGKNATTALDDAARDYVSVMDTLYDLAGYLVVNVSSPNTQGLRELQERRALESLLGTLVGRREALAERTRQRVPLLVKIAPDLDDAQLSSVVEAARASGIDGIVATNTTLSRDGVSGPRAGETGGLSGEPLRARATEVIRRLAREAGDRLPIIGAGGISQPDHALEKLDAGASLIQLYTGLIYEGPALPARICGALLARNA
ncbi:MAG TPA: dihydroorotate dehydrogenase (quinone), partial [Chloroflexota bacterium]|nr:dihydroorotate dehydrogenase (quinone) [Chloroflexota bacterium]